MCFCPWIVPSLEPSNVWPAHCNPVSEVTEGAVSRLSCASELLVEVREEVTEMVTCPGDVALTSLWMITTRYSRASAQDTAHALTIGLAGLTDVWTSDVMLHIPDVLSANTSMP